MICLVNEIIFETLFVILFVVSYTNSTSTGTLGILIRAYSGMTHKKLTYCHHLSAFIVFTHMSVQYLTLAALIYKAYDPL